MKRFLIAFVLGLFIACVPVKEGTVLETDTDGISGAVEDNPVDAEMKFDASHIEDLEDLEVEELSEDADVDDGDSDDVDKETDTNSGLDNGYDSGGTDSGGGYDDGRE